MLPVRSVEKILKRFFALTTNFLDPQRCSDGSPYGPKHFKDIVKECWFISDSLHTSYTDVLKISYQERVYLLELIKEKQDAIQKAVDASKQKQQKQNN